MKKVYKYCLILICLSLSSQLFSQNLISENKIWSIVVISGLTVEHTDTYYHKFLGDTIINGISYSKLYRSEDENGEKWKLNTFWLWFEENNRVYNYWIPTDETRLIYDFNIEEGDSFQVNGVRTLYVDSVRTIEWGGKLRKHWYLDTHGHDHPHNTVWIEGVGQTGLFTRSTESGISGASCNLLCFSENGETVFQNPEYNSCWVYITSAPSVKSQKQLVELFQTDEGNLQLKLSEETSGELFLYTIDGREVLKKTVDQSVSTFCAPASGILFYRFINEKNKVQTGKVMVK
jgi:hypothetical protein